MSTKCLKCGYIRQPGDASPDYECPKCGVVYAKMEAAVAARLQAEKLQAEKMAAAKIEDNRKQKVESQLPASPSGKDQEEGDRVQREIERKSAYHDALPTKWLTGYERKAAEARDQQRKRTLETPVPKPIPVNRPEGAIVQNEIKPKAVDLGTGESAVVEEAAAVKTEEDGPLSCVTCGYIRLANDTVPDYECPKCGALNSKAESSRLSFFTMPLPVAESWPVRILEDGSSTESTLCRMFSTHGPFVIASYRLDRLESAEVVRDASTVTTHSTSLGETSTKTGSVATRFVVGNVVAGPVGAVIGAVGARTSTETKTVSTQNINVNMYVSLKINGNPRPVVVQLFSEEAFQKILACVGQPEWPQAKLDEARDESTFWDTENKRRSRVQKYINENTLPVLFGTLILGIIITLFFQTSFIGFAGGIIATIIASFVAAAIKAPRYR